MTDHGYNMTLKPPWTDHGFLHDAASLIIDAYLLTEFVLPMLN